MKKEHQLLMEELAPKLIAFASELVQIKSYTCKEKEAALRVKAEMEALGYDQVIVDSVGSVIGIMGTGPKKVYFDGHIDTVLAKPEEWSFDPWSGQVVDGFLRGRGSVDMKASAAAAVYAAYAAKKLGYLEDKTVYVSCSVMEEDYEGLAVSNEFQELGFTPDYAVICEPTRLRIGNEHFGRALFEVEVKGVGIHASRHQMGDNALNKMIPILQRVKDLGETLLTKERAGAIASTKLETEAASINSTPGLAVLTIDRRTTPEDTEEVLAKELDQLCQGVPGASWRIVDTHGTTWTGKEAVLHNLLPAWHLREDHPLIGAARGAVSELGLEPVVYRRNGFTNGYVTAGKMGIPTIIFGAGDEAGCHIIDETCPVDQILTACSFYTLLESKL